MFADPVSGVYPDSPIVMVRVPKSTWNVARPGRYSDMESRLDIMQRMMEWRHIVPTAPDTLISYPFPTSDPFMLETCPHVFFAGNQPVFEQRMVTGAGLGLRAQGLGSAWL